MTAGPYSVDFFRPRTPSHTSQSVHSSKAVAAGLLANGIRARNFRCHHAYVSLAPSRRSLAQAHDS